MIEVHGDAPHVVPPLAYLRYKENWAFGFFDIGARIFGMVHFNYEPGHDRARFSCNLMIDGRSWTYGNRTAFPEDFAAGATIGDGVLQAHFVEDGTAMTIRLDHEDVRLDLDLVAIAPLFDFDRSDAAYPERPSFAEVLSLATDAPNHTITQAMRCTGALTWKGGANVPIDGLCYRDHSRCVRSDNMIAEHVWSFLHFPDRLFGITTLASRLRPGTTWAAGYVFDAAGLRILREIHIDRAGEAPDSMPATVRFTLVEADGSAHELIADITNRHGHVPLLPEAPGAGKSVYNLIENFCPILAVETGAKGNALIEMGYSVSR